MRELQTKAFKLWSSDLWPWITLYKSYCLKLTQWKRRVFFLVNSKVSKSTTFWYLTVLEKQHEEPSPYLTKELDRSPMNPTAAPMTAVLWQPNMSVKTLAIGQQKKIIPMDRELTHAVREGQNGHYNMANCICSYPIGYNTYLEWY